jgi:hypothetical protein
MLVLCAGLLFLGKKAEKKESEDESLCDPTKRLLNPGRDSELRLNSNLGAERPGGLSQTQTPWSAERPPCQVSQISAQVIFPFGFLKFFSYYCFLIC